MPAAFHDWRYAPTTAELFRPLGLSPQEISDRNATPLRFLGRRSSNLSRTDAEQFIAGFGARVAADFPAANPGVAWRTVSLDETVGGPGMKVSLSMLIALSGFVLLIACSNLANFQLVRTMARAREFAVRSAMGASRFQLLRPLAIESLVLALAGGVCAILVTMWATDYLTLRSTGDGGDFAPLEQIG